MCFYFSAFLRMASLRRERQATNRYNRKFIKLGTTCCSVATCCGAKLFMTLSRIDTNEAKHFRTAFNLFTRHTRGRARVGERAARQVGNSKGHSLTFIIAIPPEDGLVYFDPMPGV